MLRRDELAQVAAQFGVADSQVERDYLISLILAHLSDMYADSLLFIGGTALSRTHLPQGRLSEDVDLVALGNRGQLAQQIQRTLPRALRRAYGSTQWSPGPADVRDTQVARLQATGTTVGVRVQLLSRTGIADWPTEQRQLHQRYTNAPSAQLRVPTRAAFAAWKTVAWCDRRAPRDLWDLWALNRMGAIDREAAHLFRSYGPTNTLPAPWRFETAPSEDEWQTQLSQQTQLEITAAQALREVRIAWSASAD
ncbi:nucleotidyl transferase AbiEii/AbiGii toxin family protein [Hoyosella sp. YIM 151337]|uniref:nucleotidyl transferase AbiEii/AbiGii toxin family protein n=1 Tax=Hoyosella sp. YIM 151337 TaxID=2992742 RepID=UPI002236A0B1|nr:nucleotidyl transferase AbiEii/AbiGii toxin family protein [Hoyosella sp. YIM 151337]MCW4354122.1 nucleotidyl transferase AbiEii/AbiGii toxin family protein [Hoyosella sp. YIM 151337]